MDQKERKKEMLCYKGAAANVQTKNYREVFKKLSVSQPS